MLVFDGLELGGFFCAHVFWCGLEEGFPGFGWCEMGMLEVHVRGCEVVEWWGLDCSYALVDSS